MEKRIEVIELPVKEIKNGFGNPRKISKAKRDELQQSLEDFGDFGLILVDENNNVIAGNQRVSIMRQKDDSQKVLCKRLVGYTESELRAINIKDNTHAGEWDLDLLADWTADITVDLGIKVGEKNPDERKIDDMELIHYEKYDYVMIVCRTELDYLDLTRKLGIAGKKIKIAKKRKINARAIWYEDMKCQITDKEEDDDSSDAST